ncbi:MAG: hypothetical protein A2275_19065 [Bacteroidetes bacterium RIFOXYA12_FULL_35_11]|nr:MAG: hypothetical protein A2X01_03625 [Bacteroidetes bacterium GWF2_35_48]OFY77307.1 MAG: hypothetical protein A2275_19065 [Bacteroidetes bacterium RIFOXYA12_FULL_35_11]OFY93224.1 MAG: hypothetical protein A2309_00905 [Bacteroidetes bacterium RIFOXYB2_FULL_35_7]OFY96666.1 MAG: hypothetical protein A2491_09050 [Bacteroidetes bacterium RIFOXYC12_FULL_35_7]HBX51037.1 hypothetical protein [Bacteroidales bacterium]
MTNQKPSEAICCPEFEPSQWDDKIIDWNKKTFIKDKVCTFLYMPLNFGNVMRRLDKKVREASASVPEYLCLSEHTSAWNINLYLAVDKKIPDSETIVFSGSYYCKVYEGNFKDTGKWCKDFESTIKTKGYCSEKMFMWYTTCPKCAKKYGKNYVVILGKIK